MSEMEFEVGDFVYIDESKDIGIVTDVRPEMADPYRVDYCQNKDPLSPRRGGNGPVWRKGYPQEVTDPADVVFVHAARTQFRIAELKKKLGYEELCFDSLQRAHRLLTEPKP